MITTIFSATSIKDSFTDAFHHPFKLMKYSIIKILMLNLRRKATTGNQLSAQQCKQLLSNKFTNIIKQHFINQQQEKIVNKYTNGIKKDMIKEQFIKDQLVNQFFTINKNNKRRYFLQEKLSNNENSDFQVRRRLSKEFKRSMRGSREMKNRSQQTPRPSTRYEQSPPPSSQSTRRRMVQTPSLENRSSVYSSQINNIIQEAHKVSTKPSRFKRNILTATDRKKLVEQTDQDQKQEIIDKIIEMDVNDFLKFQSVLSHSSNPQERKKHFEESKIKELTNFDKYNISFVNYVKQKTFSNIEKSIYNEKVRQKQSYVEKFQKFILTQFKFSEEAKRRLSTIFKAIELEYKRPSKNRQFSERMPKR